MGSGPDMLLLHGLGATKTSFFDTAEALSRDYRVHALDLPGFGSSSKPALAKYSARYFAEGRVCERFGREDAQREQRAQLVEVDVGGEPLDGYGGMSDEPIGAE